MTDVSNQFSAPAEHTNVVLIIDRKKLHVSKEFLAINSPVFSAMFFGEFAEKGKEEVEIKKVDYEHFVDLLNVIHPGWTKITASSFEHIVKLADQFQMKEALEQVEQFLLKTNKVKVQKKLCLANQYKFKMLVAPCINSFSCINEISALESLPEFANFSDDIKSSIGLRALALLRVRSGEHACTCKGMVPAPLIVSSRECPPRQDPPDFPLRPIPRDFPLRPIRRDVLGPRSPPRRSFARH